MAKTNSLAFAVSPASTQAKPLVNINGDDYEVSQLQAVVQTVRGLEPTDTFSRTLSPAVADTDKPAAASDNAKSGLQTPA